MSACFSFLFQLRTENGADEGKVLKSRPGLAEGN
jgi:hypothetical protein